MIRRGLVVACLLGALAVPAARAQSPVTPPAETGTFARLSPGARKIVQALFEAQTATALSRDDIAALRRRGMAFGQIFQQMKAQGLIREKTLRQVVSQYERRQRDATASPAAGLDSDLQPGPEGDRRR